MTDWQPRPSFEETLKDMIVPPRFYYWLRGQREKCRGEKEIALLPFLVDKTRNSLDIGANKGVYTYWLESLSTHVYAYEPNPKMFSVLTKHAGKSKNATLRNIALSNAEGEATLLLPHGTRGFSNQGGSLKSFNRDQNTEREFAEVKVQAKRLDDEGIENIGFMKIDVEGFEFEVIEGAHETIQRDKPVLLVEMEERHSGIPVMDGVKTICELGYEALYLYDGQLTPFSQYVPPKDGDVYVNNFIFLPVK